MVNYPNGKRYIGPSKTTKPAKDFPKKNNLQKDVETFKNRGMSLEEDINASNEYYLSRDIAVIHKKPTPIQIVRVEYPQRSGAVIKEAYFKQASTTDYNGIYKGRHLDFEAKETKNKTSFPLSNFHEHQVTHMRSVQKQGGLAFVFVRFVTQDETYVMDAKHIIDFWDKKEKERKSIPYDYFKEKGELIQRKFHPKLDFISAIENLYAL